MKTFNLLGVVVGCLVMGLAGCGEGDKAAAPTVAAEAAPMKAPAASPKVPQYEPEYAIAIEESITTPKRYTVTYSAKVNSGGWEFKDEKVLVEEHMGMMAARIYVTLDEPGASEQVTQAMQAITGKYNAGTTKVERVEFSVKRGIRGITYDTPALYSVVKTIKYPY